MAQSEETTFPIVQRDEGRSGTYRVQLPGESRHYVGFRLDEDDAEETFCTCSPDEEAQSPGCPHAQAVRRYKERQQAEAHTRRERGLTYAGHRAYLGEERYRVLVYEGETSHPLDPAPSQALRNHSPEGFSWGYDGSGPAQLALAILLDYTGDEELALWHYQAFVRRSS